MMWSQSAMSNRAGPDNTAATERWEPLAFCVRHQMAFVITPTSSALNVVA
jgi:hypothetical protein